MVQGDCLELMRQIPDGAVDAVITDPPYGVSWATDYKQSLGGKHNADRRTYPPVFGDDKPFDPAPWFRFRRVVLFGANVFSDRLPRGSWLVWDKRFPNGESFLADGEAAWMNSGFGIHIKTVTWQGYVRTEETFHPTQKPSEVMMWAIEKAGMPETILDPYSGSGSTLVAAKKLGRHYLGFEISPEYCAIARKRLAAVEAQPRLFEPKPEQLPIQM